jgi:hypothetical protein
MTPAHSAGTADFSSLRQLATMASRSMVRTPVAVAVAAANAAAAFASGDNMPLAAIDLGSETELMPHFTRGAGAVQPRNAYQ